jgi:hypothetical protein
MTKRRNQWRGVSTGVTAQGAATILSLLLLTLANGHLFAQERSPSAIQGPCGNCPYLCVNRQCINAEIAQPLDLSVCAPVSAHYVCIDKKTSNVFVATPEQYNAKPMTPGELEQFKKDAASNNSTNK